MRLRGFAASAALAAAIVALPAAAPAHASGCSTARGVHGSNPSYAQVGAAIDAAAGRHHVPPPVLKAIAWKESGWQQFWPDGRAKVSPDCGIGIMQITGGNWDYAKLGGDYVYNVNAGAQVLAEKMAASSANVPPSLGNDVPEVAENWYRATYRYNGSGARAEQYADAVTALVRTPPDGIRAYDPAVPITNPKNVVRGYSPTSGAAFVARPDGTWVSTLGTFHGPIWRADFAAVAGDSVSRRMEANLRKLTSLGARNVGWQTWTDDRVRVGTWPLGRTSHMRDQTWSSPKAFGHLKTATAPGASGRWYFVVHAPSTSKTVTLSEAFVPTVDGSLGMGGAAAKPAFTIDVAHAPTASISAAPVLASTVGPQPRIVVRYTGRDPSPGSGVGYYQVHWRRSCSGCAWSTPLRRDSTWVILSLATPGATYFVEVRAVDVAGHVGAWSAPRTIVLPYDDRDQRLSYSAGWVAESLPDSWLGSVHAAGPLASTVTASLTGSNLVVIGVRQPGSNSAQIFVDGELLTTVHPTASTTQPRSVLWRATVSAGTHTLTIKAMQDGSAPFALDGLAAA